LPPRGWRRGGQHVVNVNVIIIVIFGLIVGSLVAVLLLAVVVLLGGCGQQWRFLQRGLVRSQFQRAGGVQHGGDGWRGCW